MNLFVSDLDGTLLGKDEAISGRSIEIINRLISQGVSFSVATARSLEGAKNILEPLNLKLPIVLFNGVEVYCPVEKKIINDNYLNKSITFDLIKELDNEEIKPFVFTRDDKASARVFVEGKMNFGQEAYANSVANKDEDYFTSVDSYNAIGDRNIISIAALELEAKLLPIYNRLKSLDNIQVHLTEDIYIDGYYWLEIGQLGSSKKEGVRFVKEYLNAQKLITFGDNLNDISMFELADEKYAVSNARDELKELATDIIGKNTDDGVARFIEEYIKGIS